MPILLASRELSPVPLAIFSGQRLDVDPGLGPGRRVRLHPGSGPPVPPLRAPIATIVEAKKNDIEAGPGPVRGADGGRPDVQPGGRPRDVDVFGCVTTGEVWQFLQLVESKAMIDRRIYYLDDLEGILAAIQEIIARSDAPGPRPAAQSAQQRRVAGSQSAESMTPAEAISQT